MATGGCGSLRLEWVVSLVTGERRKNPGRGDGRVEWTIRRLIKNELLFQCGINFNELPLWQRRGTGMYWETYEKAGYDPVRQVEVAAARRRLRIDETLPMKEAYGALIQAILEANS